MVARMADQGGLRSSGMMALVLSIFKGENFVVKGLRTPCEAHLKAICSDLQPELALNSQPVELTPTVTEPDFNTQLVFSMSRKQLKELRSNRSTIKVVCLVTDRTGTVSEVGYIVLHVKDATMFASDVIVDASKAATVPLLGTKDRWRALQPRLQIILYLEETPPGKGVFNRPNPVIHGAAKPALPVLPELDNLVDSTEKTDLKIKNGAKLSETKVLPLNDTNKFVWTIREEDGYFQLGDSTEDDDMYMLNITVVSVCYLHSLWDGKSSRKCTPDNNFWQIKYEAYGCEISSDPFLLQNDDVTRRTFVGDKATAKIRANGAMFFEYLQNTNLQFQVIRYQLGQEKELTNPEVMGICFASLNGLATSFTTEYKLTMDVLSEWGTPRVVTVHGKPEVRVVFNLEAMPNFFKLYGTGLKTNDNSSHPPQDQNTPNENLQISNSEDIPSNDAVFDVEKEDKRIPIKAGNTDIDVETLSNTSNVRRLLKFEEKVREDASLPSSSSLLTSPERQPNENSLSQQQHRLSHPSDSTTSESEDSDSTSNKENLARILPPPGEYIVTIELDRFWLKSKRVISDNFILSYSHSPLGISGKPIECYAQPIDPSPSQTRQGFLIKDGKYTKTVTISKFTEKLLNEPLTVEFFRSNQEGNSKSFASAMLPFGRIFLEDRDEVKVIEDSADILKRNQNQKIGTLFFKIKMVHQSSSVIAPERNANDKKQQKHSTYFPPSSVETNKPLKSLDIYSRETDKVEKVTEDMKNWRRDQEEMYKRQKEESETAYLKILSEEAAKRDAERESAVAKKLKELEKKQKEVDRLLKLTEEREEKLKQMDSELKDKARSLALEQESLKQKSTLALRRLEEDHKIEVEVLQRRIQDFQDDGSKLKRKIQLLEKKLETKEVEIDNLTALTRTLPDMNMVKRVSTLEEENKSLKTLLREANGRKEQYKKQSLALCQKLNHIQEERDQELKDQNENLRLQILASQEHKELKKERKAVQGLSQTLKALHKETLAPPSGASNDGQGDYVVLRDPVRKSSNRVMESNVVHAKEDEIKRLVAERTKLLQSGAYSNLDAVIKELEKKMASLAST